MTLQQLDYILALDKYRHFIKAAESCFVSQPTLTLQLQKLEEEIGIKVFDRSTTPFKPTELGIKFIEKAKLIMLEVSQLKDIVTNEKNDESGILKIGIIPSLSPYLLPLFLDSFSKKHSKLFLEIEEIESEKIIKKLNEGYLDIALMVTPLKEKSLKEIFLFKEPFLVFCNRNHKLFSKKEIDLADLNGDGLWLLKEGHCFRNQVLEICNLNSNPNSQNFSFEANSIETLKNLIIKNFGYTLIPEMSVKECDTDYIRKFSKDYTPARDVSIVTHKSFTRTAILDSLRQEILDVVPMDYIKNDYFIRIDWK